MLNTHLTVTYEVGQLLPGTSPFTTDGASESETGSNDSEEKVPLLQATVQASEYFLG